MPVQGLPDLELHRACSRCEQFFEEHEGRMVEIRSAGLAGAIRSAAGDSKFQFVCAACETRGHRRFAKVIVVLLILIGLFWAWQERGWP